MPKAHNLYHEGGGLMHSTPKASGSTTDTEPTKEAKLHSLEGA